MTKTEVVVSKTFSATFLCLTMMTLAGCYMAIRSIAIDPQFATLWGVVVTYYFGKSKNDNTPPVDTRIPDDTSKP